MRPRRAAREPLRRVASDRLSVVMRGYRAMPGIDEASLGSMAPDEHREH